MLSTDSSSTEEADSEEVTYNNLIPFLPNDVALSCLVRVPRSHHPTLSLVSKPIRSLISSPLFFNTRTLHNCTQPLLYFTLRSPAYTHLWYTLQRNLLLPIPPIPYPAVGSAYAVIGPTIYVIGGSINGIPSSSVWLLDCRFHRWLRGPNMRVTREFAAAGVVDGKIYVIGGCIANTWARSTNWAEVLDPAAGKWEPVANPVEVREKWMHASAVIDGKVYAMADRGGIVFDPRSCAWDSVGSELDLGWRGRTCVIDGILYCYDYLGKIKGFDVKLGVWKELKGLDKNLAEFLCGATMANVGGNLFVAWEKKGNGKEMEIWCAEIEVKKDGDGKLWGVVCWHDKVLSVPKLSSIVQCSSVVL